MSRRTAVIIGGILGGILLLTCLCCVSGSCCRDRTKQSDYYQKKREYTFYISFLK